MSTDPPTRTLKFCRHCNARERVIVRGKCLVCGCDPSARVDSAATDPPPVPPMEYKFAGWSRLDIYVLVLCIVATWYLVIQVVRALV